MYVMYFMPANSTVAIGECKNLKVHAYCSETFFRKHHNIKTGLPDLSTVQTD